LHIDNPNPNLRFYGNLFESAWVWYYNIAGGIRAIFTLPHKMPNSYASLDFCTWYFMANNVPRFEINISCIKVIKYVYKAKEVSKGYQMREITE